MDQANAGSRAQHQVADRHPEGAVVGGGPAFLFDLDGTLVDSVYQHVLAWREALEAVGIELSVWRIHRRIGMSGGPMANPILRETRPPGTPPEGPPPLRPHPGAHAP